MKLNGNLNIPLRVSIDGILPSLDICICKYEYQY